MPANSPTSHILPSPTSTQIPPLPRPHLPTSPALIPNSLPSSQPRALEAMRKLNNLAWGVFAALPQHLSRVEESPPPSRSPSENLSAQITHHPTSPISATSATSLELTHLTHLAHPPHLTSLPHYLTHLTCTTSPPHLPAISPTLRSPSHPPPCSLNSRDTLSPPHTLLPHSLYPFALSRRMRNNAFLSSTLARSLCTNPSLE